MDGFSALHKICIRAHIEKMLQPLWEFNDVLKTLGGATAVARLCKQQPSAVTNWRRRVGRFPCRYYIAIRCALEDRGYYPSLELFNFFRGESDSRAA